MSNNNQIKMKIYSKIRDLWNKGAFHILIGDFITKFITFFGAIFLVRVLSKEEYGLLAYIENLYGYIYMLAGLGMHNSILRFLIISRDNGKQVSYYKYIVKRTFIINVLLVIFSILIFLFYKHPIEFIGAKYLLLVFMLILPFQYLYDISLLTIRAKLQIKKYSFTVIIVSLLIVTSKYLSSLYLGLNGMIIFSIFLYILISFVLTRLIRHDFGKESTVVNINKTEKKEINKYSIQFLLTNSIFALLMLNDIFMMGLFINSPTLIADYKIAFTLPANISLISTSIGIFITPYFVINENNKDWIKSTYIKLIGILIILSGLIGMVLFIFSSELLSFIFGSEYESSSNIMRVLVISAFINSVFRYTTANILNSLGHVKVSLFASIIGIVFQVLLNILLIPSYGPIGTAYTSVAVYSLMSIILVVYFMKIYFVKNR